MQLEQTEDAVLFRDQHQAWVVTVTVLMAPLLAPSSGVVVVPCNPPVEEAGQGRWGSHIVLCPAAARTKEEFHDCAWSNAGYATQTSGRMVSGAGA